MSKWCQVPFYRFFPGSTTWLPAYERYRRQPVDGPISELPKDGARCALELGHAGNHVFAREEPLPDLVTASSPAWAPSSTTTLLDGRERAAKDVVNHVSFDVTQEVGAALRSLRDTGLFGAGDCASVAEELLRWALRQPAVSEFWKGKQK